LDEYNQVHAKWQAAEDRIGQLEVYIKEQSAKQFLTGDAKERDEEIQTLRQIILAGGIELQKVNAELQALRAKYEQKIQLWEQGARRLLGVAEQTLGQRNEQEVRCHENGHFANTATKVSLTLSKDKEGGNVDSLRRLLKDALTQNGTADDKKNKNNKDRKSSAKIKLKEEPAKTSVEESASEEGKQAAQTGAGLSDSNASSRDTSPGPALPAQQVVGRNGYCGDASQSSVAALPFVSQLASEIRQLLSSSQEMGLQTATSQASTSPKPAAIDADRSKVQEIIDSMAPARKGVATSIIMVEKMLRGLELDLRKQCEDLLGSASIEVQIVDINNAEEEDAAYAVAIGNEAKLRIPLREEDQILSISALRRAQQRSSAMLAQFVQLPQKLKAVFDLTKKLGVEATSLVPAGLVHQLEARAAQARLGEQRQSFHVELLQKRLQGLTCKVEDLGGKSNDDVPKEETATEKDVIAVAREIQEDTQQGIPPEEQLMAARSRIRDMTRELTSNSERMRYLEKEVVDLQLSRYNERAQCLALFQQSAGLQQGGKSAPWPWPPGAKGC
jgi:hypothetical protein